MNYPSPGNRAAFGTTAALLVLLQAGALDARVTAAVDPCAGAIPGSAQALACPDSDGDGFTDLEEENGYIDVNLDGVFDAGDFEFPRERQFLFSDVTHDGSGTGMVFPTVVDPARPIGHTRVLITIASGGRVGAATFTYQLDGGRPSAPATVRPVVDLGRNLRLMFYLSGWSAGDTYAFTVSTGPTRKVADPRIPNIYVQYDFMGWGAPGAPCSSDDDAGPTQLNLVCHDGFLNHTDAPGDPLFRKVVDQFAEHGIRLHIDPVHAALPHATVVTFASAGDSDNGPLAVCAGWNVTAGDIANGRAVSFFDIKNRPGSDFAFDPVRRFVYHYGVFGHFNTCVTDDPDAASGNCNACPPGRGPASGLPLAGASGWSELPGNDLIVSMGASYFDPVSSVPRNPFSEQGTFMHELGHNLGLTHNGDQYGSLEVDDAVNYLSVMSYQYTFTGIQHAAVPGSIQPVELLRSVDYSEHALASLDESNLDESAGVSPLAAGYTGIVRFFDARGGFHLGPESGGIDWNGDGTIESEPISVDVNGDGDLNARVPGYADWSHGPCTGAADTPINQVRLFWHYEFDLSIDPHEPCVQGRAQSLWYAFQISRWGKVD